jgi:adenine-specific DNA-methyltransferase
MAKRPAKPKGPTPVEAIKHKDTRKNIPTEELRDFIADDEAKPKTMLYPRDPSLDPQLVWKGKDQQDQADLAVPVVPIYIQEKVHPQAIIEHLRNTAKAGEREPELTLFDDFNGLDDFDKKVDFYRWDQHWSNRMILGDSLLVMTSLAEKEGLKGKVQMIYLDPPYGIKFGSNWQVSTREPRVVDGKAEHATRQPEQVRAFRDTWQLGIHSYLAYLRDRLAAARDLLTPTGSAFLQIGDDNVHLVRAVMDEVFGSGCCVVTILVKKKGSQRSGLMAPVNDYILWYSKTPQNGPADIRFRPLFEQREWDSDTLGEYKFAELSDGTVFDLTDAVTPEGEPFDYRLSPKRLLADYPGVRVFRANPLTSGGERPNQSLPFSWQGKTFSPPKGSCWKHTARRTNDQPCGMERLAMAGRLIAGLGTWRFKSYLDDHGMRELSNWWDGLGGAKDPVYVVQTNTEIVKRCMLMTTDPGDLVLDPTCGSGTTALVAEEWGRRWITCDTSRVALTLARTRLMSARFPWYLLLDSPDGQKKEAEATARATTVSASDGDIKKGFVYRRARHLTSSSIANNPKIIESAGADEIERALSAAAREDAIALQDSPYEDSRRIRVTGPFTVESLSPHRVLSTDDERPRNESIDRLGTGGDLRGVAQFETMILDNLRKAGVQNTVKKERLVFDRLEPLAGTWLHAGGTYTDADGKSRRVAVSIGPEHGTVGPNQVKEAAKQAVLGVGFDVLIVCGFAFDPHVSEEAKRYGKLQVLTARMNPDLSMGEELLKKTGAGNLFMVFGEPDVEIAPTDVDGNLQATLRGVDVYDPTTGQIRNSSTDDIACWFIDTNYDGESFFVRHAYFTGADEPYEKLKRALKADIDEAAWATLYSTVSRPFAPPETGKIAVKVINHYGDEVLKVFEV